MCIKYYFSNLIKFFPDFGIVLFNFHRDDPKFPDQSPQVPDVPIRPWTLGWWVFHLLRELGGHSHLRLRTHVSVLHLWHQAQEDVQRLLSNLQKANQRHNQDLPEHIRERKAWLHPNNVLESGEKRNVTFQGMWTLVLFLALMSIRSLAYHFSRADTASFRRSFRPEGGAGKTSLPKQCWRGRGYSWKLYSYQMSICYPQGLMKDNEVGKAEPVLLHLMDPRRNFLETGTQSKLVTLGLSVSIWFPSGDEWRTVSDHSS